MWRQCLDKLGEQASLYNAVQRLVGSERVWSGFICSCEVLLTQWNPNDLWLDLGCGTAEILSRLPENIVYLGIDNNPQYIAFAKQKYKQRPNTHFICADWNDTQWQTTFPTLSIGAVSLLGLLHHLNDQDAQNILTLSLDLVKENGTLITLDGCNEIHASIMERFFYWIDRGNYVRSAATLKQLFPHTPNISLHSDWLRVPYCYAVCQMVKI